MNENRELAKAILETVGGQENVKSIAHCATRLRFELKDDSVGDEKIKAIKGVIGVVRAGGQVQVVVGPQVEKIYNEALDLGHFERKEVVNENLDEKKKVTLKSIGAAILGYVQSSVVTCIPAMTASALFKALQVLLGDTLHVIDTTGGFYLFCTIMYNSFFYFMPIFVGYTAAKKLKMTPVLGMFAGAMLVVPDFLNLSTTEGASLSLLGMNVQLLNYSQTLLPVLLIVWVMSYLEKFFKKYLPNAITGIFTPFLTVLIGAPLGYLLLAPLGNTLGNYVGNALISINSVIGPVGQLLIGASWNFIVMSGMHMVIVMVAITNLMTNGVDYSMVGAGAAQWAVLGMALGAFLRIANKEAKGDALGAFVTCFLGGITEPSLYGVGMKYKRPLICMVIAGAIGGLYLGITHVGMFQVVMGGNFLTSLLAYVGPTKANMINCVIGDAGSAIIAAITTYFWGFEKDDPALKK